METINYFNPKTSTASLGVFSFRFLPVFICNYNQGGLWLYTLICFWS